ncbi:hypothetical protein BS17DRAFT_765129 [Gyrodon lividus]|nr:hypothetical protein BS17DRAFT_765129 [Gyrodon lividus]
MQGLALPLLLLWLQIYSLPNIVMPTLTRSSGTSRHIYIYTTSHLLQPLHKHLMVMIKIMMRKVNKDDDSPKTVDPEEREDHAHVWSKLVQALLKVGCKWASGKLFPWKSLPAKLAKSSVRGINYSVDVSFPGKEQNPCPKGGSKGISDLSFAECSMLVTALRDTSRVGLHFKLAVYMKGAFPIFFQDADLMATQVPVIDGTAPKHDSPCPCAKKMFCNLKTDCKGLPQKSHFAATHVKKRTACTPLSEYQPKEDTSKASEELNQGLVLEPSDFSNYEQGHDSWKCKRKLNISLHTSKKHAVSPEPISTKVPPSKGKGKVKAQSSDGHAPDVTVPSLEPPHVAALNGIAPVVEEQDSDAHHTSTTSSGGNFTVPSQHRPLSMMPLATSTELPTRENTILISNPQPMRPKLTLAKKKIPDANQDPNDVFSLCKWLQPPHKSETDHLSTLSANLLAAEEGCPCASFDQDGHGSYSGCMQYMNGGWYCHQGPDPHLQPYAGAFQPMGGPYLQF